MSRRLLPLVALTTVLYGCQDAAPHHYYAATEHADPARVAQLPDSWPCGTGTCLDRLTWKPVPADWADALAEGEAPDATTRDWTRCWLSIGDTSFVVCPDGVVETS